MDTRITIDPAVHHGQPVIAGTRVPVAIVIGSLASGMATEDVQREYGIEREDVQAALQFAAETIGDDRYYPLSA